MNDLFHACCEFLRLAAGVCGCTYEEASVAVNLYLQGGILWILGVAAAVAGCRSLRRRGFRRNGIARVALCDGTVSTVLFRLASDPLPRRSRRRVRPLRRGPRTALVRPRRHLPRAQHPHSRPGLPVPARPADRPAGVPAPAQESSGANLGRVQTSSISKGGDYAEVGPL